MKKTITVLLCIVCLFFLFTSSWAYIAVDGFPTDRIGWGIEWGVALLLTFIILGKSALFDADFKLPSVGLVAVLLVFLARTKIFGANETHGVENMLDNVQIQYTSRFYYLIGISVALVLVSFLPTRAASNTGQATS